MREMLCRTSSVVVVHGTELLIPMRVAERTMLNDQPRSPLAVAMFYHCQPGSKW